MSDLRCAGGQGASFVEHHRADFVGPLQGFGIFDQNPVTGGHTGAGHDGGRCCQPQGAGASNHQHGDGVDQCCFNWRAIQPPADQGGEGNQQHHRNKNLADFIHQFLDRCLGCLGIFDQTNNARQYGFCAQRQGSDDQSAFAVDGAAGDFIAGLFGHGQALAADQGFIGVALTFDHFSVHRETLAGFDQH